MAQAQNQQTSAPRKNGENNSVFDVPQDYIHGRRRRLQEFYTGDWWLNVDYVEEVKLRSA